jgi:hypothetical protein
MSITITDAAGVLREFKAYKPWNFARFYEESLALLGQRVNVVLGDLVADENGPLVVSDTLLANSILVSRRKQTAVAITPLRIAQPYTRMKNDCISLSARFMDELTGTKKYTTRYRQITVREYLANLGGGAADYILELGLQEVDPATLQVNDIILGGLPDIPEITSHTAVYIGNDKILHHRPYKLSSIDDLATADIQRVFRHAN